MPGYTKLFSSIIGSTIWREPPEICKLWITMLAIADAKGMVEVSIPGLADFARLSIPAAEEGLKRLLAPDEYSRTRDNEGRRIEQVNGGWRILNYDLYRHKHSVEEAREYERVRKQEYRSRMSGTIRDNPAKSRKAEAEAEAEAVPKQLFQKEGVLGGGNHSKNFQIGKNQNPKPRKCMMPGCEHPARAGLPGAAAMFCSEVCFNHAKRLNPENFKVKA